MKIRKKKLPVANIQDGVIPKARAFTSGPRDLAWSVTHGA
jgi:hypothetical protein